MKDMKAIGLALLAQWIGKIQNLSVRLFVLDVLNSDMVPDYFWTAPASSSGKYHPKWELGVGGLVRHTCLVASYFSRLIQAYELDPIWTDIGIAAAILHDCRKFSLTLNAEGFPSDRDYAKDHGVRFFRDLLDSDIFSGYDVDVNVHHILDGIRFHSGRWASVTSGVLEGSADYWPELKAMCDTVHMADMVASHRLDEQEENFLHDVPEEDLT